MNLNQNQILTEEVKEQIFMVIQEMHQKMQALGVSLPEDLLLERIKNVSIEIGNKFLNKEAYQYNAEANKLTFSVDNIEKENQANVVCQALFALAYIQDSKKPEKGIDGKEFFAITKGAFEIFANNIVPNNGEKGSYEDEQIIINLVNDVTDGKLLDGILQADSEKIRETIEKYNLSTSNHYANYNLIARKSGCLNSQLGEIQKQLIDHFFEKSPVEIKKQLHTIESHLATTPEMMSNPSQYRDLPQINHFFRKKKEECFNLDKGIPVSSKPIPEPTPADFYGIYLGSGKSY